MGCFGVDVSSYQPSNYSTTGLSFAFIKVTQGLSYVNPKWPAQRTTARAAGLVTGFYHYPTISNDPIAEADHFLAQINLITGDVLALDWEWYGQNVSDATARAYKKAWVSHVKAKEPNNRVVTYVDRSNWTSVDTDGYVGDGLWIADYTTAGTPGIKDNWIFHQYAQTPVDKDYCALSAADLRRWASLSPVTPTPSPDPAPKPVPKPAVDRRRLDEEVR